MSMYEAPTNEPIIPQVPVSQEYMEEEYPELEFEHFKRHPDQLVKPEARECGSEVEKLEGLMAEFEEKHSLAELNAITEISADLASLFKYVDELENPEKIENTIKCFERNNSAYVEIYKAKITELRATVLTPEDARKFEIRRTAMKDERVITDLAEKIRKETNISKEQLETLQTRRKLISNAIGSINGGKVVHDR